MELNPVNWKIIVPEPHNRTVVGACIDDKAFRNILYDQRMIAGCCVGGGEASENAAIIVRYRRCLTMHKTSANDCSAEMLTYCLMAKTYSE